MITREKIASTLEAIKADQGVWVAGSAAVCPSRAGDIDIWVCLPSNLKAKDFMWPDIDVTKGYETIPVKAKKEIVYSDPASGDVKIQIMWVEQPIHEILDSFDVSCHAFARNREGYVLAHPKATRPGKPIVWINKPPELEEKLLCSIGAGCYICDNARAQRAAMEASGGKTRLELFTERYADVKEDEIWLP